MRLARLVTSVCVIAFALLAATACGAGQVASTATQGTSLEGSNGERGGIALRAVLIPTPLTGVYKSGGQAPLHLSIASDEGVMDTLVAVTTDAAQSVVLVKAPGASGSASPSGTPASASPADSASSGSASPSLSPSPSPSPSPSAIDLPIAPAALLVLGDDTTYLQLQDLTRDLMPGNTVRVSFSFARAGDITLEVPVATPDTPAPRPTSSQHTGNE